MIQLTDAFELMARGEVPDVASSLLGQGCLPEISIPIYAMSLT